MTQTNDLDPAIQEFVDRAVLGIAVPRLRLAAATGTGAHRSRSVAILLAGLAIVLLVGSGAAAATGLLSEVFRIGNVSAVGSRATTLSGARVAQVPLPASGELVDGWTLGDVQLTMTETWRSVELHYGRIGSRGMSIGIWSEGISVVPASEKTDLMTVSGVEITVGSGGGQRTARFEDRGATVIVRGFADELGTADIRRIVEVWLARAR